MSTTDQEIIISRVFDAPRELVFAAWTDPRHVERWWGPNGYTSTGCEMALHAGGVFRLDMRGPDGSIYPCRGVFRELVKPERIVYAGASEESPGCGAGLPPRAVVTVTFAEHGKKTTVTIHTQLASAADRAATENAGYVPGWTQTLERLAAILEEA